MNSANTSFDQYKKAKNNLNTARTGSYICFGTAAGIYILNLVRSYIAQPRPNAPLQWTISSDMTSNLSIQSNYIPSFGVSICYYF